MKNLIHICLIAFFGPIPFFGWPGFVLNQATINESNFMLHIKVGVEIAIDQ